MTAQKLYKLCVEDGVNKEMTIRFIMLFTKWRKAQ